LAGNTVEVTRMSSSSDAWSVGTVVVDMCTG